MLGQGRERCLFRRSRHRGNSQRLEKHFARSAGLTRIKLADAKKRLIRQSSVRSEQSIPQRQHRAKIGIGLGGIDTMVHQMSIGVMTIGCNARSSHRGLWWLERRACVLSAL